MAKQPKWSTDEKRRLFDLFEDGKSYDEISAVMGRSVNGIKIARNRQLAYEPKCAGCSERILRPLGVRKWKPAERCEACRKERKKEFYRDYFNSGGKEKLAEKRNSLRFGGNRELAIKRDGGKCVRCGMTREEHREKFGCDITVDHKAGGDRDRKRLDSALSKLQTLCLPCQGKKDWVRRRKDWSMCGAALRRYWQERKETGGFQFRCPCGNIMRIQYDPLKNYRRLKKERCGKCR